MTGLRSAGLLSLLLLLILAPLAHPARLEAQDGPGDSSTPVDSDAPDRWDMSLLAPVELSAPTPAIGLRQLALKGHSFGAHWQIGRTPVNMGPSPRENLILSGATPVDGIWVARKYPGTRLYPPFHLEGVLALLDVRGGTRRFLTARRYVAELEGFCVGFQESAVLSGADLHPFYFLLHPLLPIEVIQLFIDFTNRGSNLDCNMMMGVEAGYSWPQTADDSTRRRLYAVFLVDDMPPTDAHKSVPYRLSFQAGVDYPLSLTAAAPLRLHVEYTALSRFMYAHLAVPGDYLYGDRLLGHPLGPDADRLSAELHSEVKGWPVWLGLDLERHGEGDLNDRYDAKTCPRFEFLSGVVQSTGRARAGGSWRLSPNAELRLELSIAYHRNLGNTAGKSQLSPGLDAGLELSF